MILCPQLLYVLKAKLVQFVSCALSGPYILEVVYMGLVQLSSVVSPKRHVTACAISTKGEARLHGLRAPLVSKSKLGHLVRVFHWSYREAMILCPQFLYVLNAKLVKYVFCSLSDHYILEVIYMGLVQLSSVVSRKRYVSACTISTKGKMSFWLVCVIDFKIKAMIFYCVLYYIFIFKKLYTFV